MKETYSVESATCSQARPGFVAALQSAWFSHTRLLRCCGITAIVLFGFLAGMEPHLNSPYPMHVDEWFGLGHSQSVLDSGSLQYISPYGGGAVGYHPQMGFHLLLAFSKATTGLDWMDLYRIAPGVQVALLTLLVYVMGRRDGYGWAAALFVPLIPTSIRTLGLTFLVPISLSLLVVPVTILILHNRRIRDSDQSILWLLLVMIAGTMFIHPATEGVVTGLTVMVLILVCIELLFRRKYRAGILLFTTMALRAAIPLLILMVWIPSMGRQMLAESVQPFVTDSFASAALLGFNVGYFQAFGVLAAALAVPGTFLFIWESPYGVRSVALPVFTLGLLVYLTYAYERYGIGPGSLYERGWAHLGLLLAILAGYGIAYYFRNIKGLLLRIHLPPSGTFHHVSYGFLILVGLSVLFGAVGTGFFREARGNYAHYYQMVTDQLYLDFKWIGAHTTADNKVVMLEQSTAWSYPVIAGPGNSVLEAASSPFWTVLTGPIQAAVYAGEVETDWLRQKGVGIVYTRNPRQSGYARIQNRDINEIRPGVFLVVPPVE